MLQNMGFATPFAFHRDGKDGEKRMSKVELLAPAGSYESMTAAVSAGADAVYIGGHKFGARAYADNPGDDRLLEAIDYVHLHGRRLYLTVNTLMKERELEEELYAYLDPLYREGLDAVIVQDMGALVRIRQWFPDLPVHASTQMTLTGPYGASLLKEMGASRIVTARELSLEEIREIHDTVDIEIESFVHGALCYCYSGQCLFSSIAGGRSGNRGRCAQPCRMAYQVYEDNRMLGGIQDGFVLSPKDLNTIDLLPEIIESGVYSLKIEGRMKKPEYTAGVVSIYRKYLDAYLEHGKEGYRVSREDHAALFQLFNRKGFTEGYYKKHNGKDMITLAKPDFRAGDGAQNESLRARFLETELKEKLNGNVRISQYLPAKMTVTCAKDGGMSVSVEGEIPGEAQRQPLTRQSVEKQMRKTGGTPFVWDTLEIQVEDGLFLPVVQLNELRRRAFAALTEKIQGQYRRTSACPGEGKSQIPSAKRGQTAARPLREGENGAADRERQSPVLAACVETQDQLEAVLKSAVKIVYVDTLAVEAEHYRETVLRAHRAGKTCLLALPQIFRREAKAYWAQKKAWILEAGFDGYLVRSLEEAGMLRREGVRGEMVMDHMMYSYNRQADQWFYELGSVRNTAPVELNGREWRERGCQGAEVIVYGRLPMMVSAQCIRRTTVGCDKKAGLLHLRDRMGNRLPVKNECRYCMNTIYNGNPLSLLDVADEVRRLRPDVCRLNFTVESRQETEDALRLFEDAYGNGKKVKENIPGFTRGHYKRGVE